MTETDQAAARTLRLIVRADDAGCARSANHAIAETVRHGIVRNVSIMAVGPALEHAADLLAGLPGVSFGLHATINSEWLGLRWGPVLPPTRVPSLIEPDGAFTSAPSVLHARGFRLEHLADELDAQLNRVRRAGFRLDYIDTHMGFGWLPGVAPILEALAAREGLPLDHPSTHPRLPAALEPLEARIAAAAGGPYVLVVHPAQAGPELHAFHNADHPPGRVAADREAERRALLDPRLLRQVQVGELVLETYARAPAPALCISR